MLILHGFSASNYHNVVKLALLEKGLPFQEQLVYTGAGEQYRPEYLNQSPLGKVPCLQTEHGFISESRCIIDYLERAYPESPLYPREPFAIAKLLELTQVIDLYLELTARRVLPYYFARKPVPSNVADDVRATLSKGVKAVTNLARFDDYLLGGHFSAADVAATIHFPAVRFIATKVLECDPFGALPDLLAYLERMEQRPHVQRIRREQAEDRPKFFEHIKQRYAT